MYKGIDVSKYQGVIDWPKVKAAGIEFVIIRASYGKDGLDKCFKDNIEGAHVAGLPCGAYHYCYAKTVEGAKVEAQHFINVIKGYKLEYPVVLDLEDKCQDGIDIKTLTDMAIAFLEVLEGAGYFAAIYANKSWFTSRLNMGRLKPYTVWLAQWADKPTIGGVGIWQYTSSGTVDGIGGRVDMDISYNDYQAIIKTKELNGFGKVAVQPAPAPAPSKPGTPDVYVVQSGDTLSGIASKFNIAGGYVALAKLNGIANPNLIQPGQKIKLKVATAPQPASANAKPTIREAQHAFNTMGAKIAEDNIYGPKTQAAAPTIRAGSKNDAVKWLQRKLNYLGYKCGSVDGIFGAKTDAAVRAFQRAKKLSIDGIVGQNTWKALLTA